MMQNLKCSINKTPTTSKAILVMSKRIKGPKPFKFTKSQ